MMGSLEGAAVASMGAGGSSDAIGSSGAIGSPGLGGTMAPTSVGGGKRKHFFSKKQKRMLRRHTKKVQAQYKKFLRLARKFKGGVGTGNASSETVQSQSNASDYIAPDFNIRITNLETQIADINSRLVNKSI